MKLTKDLVRQSAGYTGAPVKKEITFTDGNTGEEVKAEVWVRRMSYHSLVEVGKVMGEDGNTDQFLAARIAGAICDEEGWPIFTLADITGVNEDGSPVMETLEDGTEVPRGALGYELVTALSEVVTEVNEPGKLKKPTS